LPDSTLHGDQQALKIFKQFVGVANPAVTVTGRRNGAIGDRPQGQQRQSGGAEGKLYLADHKD
jgi:hypothetical protein